MAGFIFPYRAKLLQKQKVTPNVTRFQIQKPFGYRFCPGQAIDLSIAQKGYELEVAPFTLTNTNKDPYLELYIKISPRKDSLTHGLASLENGAVLQLTEPWDTFTYKGIGIFIAAGTGIMPFISIFRSIASSGTLIRGHKLIFANKTKKDILFMSELHRLLGKNYINILSASKARNTFSGRVDAHFLKEQMDDLDQQFYVCGPRKFEWDVRNWLLRLGVKEENLQTGYTF